MFISSHEIEHSFSNEAQRLVYGRLRLRLLSLFLFSLNISQLSKLIILVPLACFCAYCNFCTAMMTFDHINFLPPFVKLSTSPCCTYFSSQYNSTHYNDNAQHGAPYNSTERTTLPLPGKSQCTHLSTINVHNNRPIDSAHFAQPCMSHNSTYTSPSLAHVHSNRPADSTHICVIHP